MKIGHDAIQCVMLMTLRNNLTSCAIQGMMQSSESCLGKHFLKSEHQEQEQEQEQEQQENETGKTKKAPLREGPNYRPDRPELADFAVFCLIHS